MEKQVSPWAGAVRVLWEPYRVMEAQAEKPAVMPIYLIWMLALAAGSTLMLLFNQEAMLGLAAEQMTPEQGLNPEALLPVFIAGSIFTSFLMPWLMGVLQGFIFWIMGNFTGAVKPFRQYLILAGYAAIPGLVGTFLKLAVDPANANGVQFGPALFIETTSKAATAFLASFDLFSIWGIIITVIGFAALHRTEAKKVWWVGGVIWALTLGLTLLMPAAPL